MPPANDYLLPIQSGKKISQYDLNIQSDCDINGTPCDNISGKNACYGEFDVIYWAWKHIKKIYPDLKYIVYSQYRRLFAFDRYEKFRLAFPCNDSDILNYKVSPYELNEIKKILDDGYIITVEPYYFYTSLKTQYNDFHVGTDYRILKDVIKNDFPDYYESFINIMEHNNRFIPLCLFAMTYNDFENYCEWLFDVLSRVEKKIHIEHYDTYQKRVLAYMAERLFGVWLVKNNKKMFHRNIYFYDPNNKPFTERNIIRRAGSLCKRFKEHLKINFAFNLTRMNFSRAVIKIFSR